MFRVLFSILKSRDISLPTQVCLVKAMVFSVVMYGCESWTIKKSECRRIDAFELWCWRRLLRVPWTARRSNQSILKEISPEYSLERLMLTLKLQYFDYLMRRTDSWKRPWTWNNRLVLTVASWSAYRFLRRQVRWSGIPISFRIFHSFWLGLSAPSQNILPLESEDMGSVSEILKPSSSKLPGQV